MLTRPPSFVRGRQIVRLVRAASGIPLAKTNVPQTLMFWECVNPTWGRTAHPRSAAHTAGGSSGGEAALLAADGAALGLGNDVGGSVRIPAAFCGVFALKPGWARGGGGGARGASLASLGVVSCADGGGRREHAGVRRRAQCDGADGPVSALRRRRCTR